MILIGALAALVSVAAAFRAVHGESVVMRRLALLAPPAARAPRWRTVDDRDLRQAALFHGHTQLLIVKCFGLVIGILLGALAGGVVGGSLPAAAVIGYAGWVAPSVSVDRRAMSRRRDAERAVGALLERLEALVASGRPVETAIVALARVPTTSTLVDAVMRRGADGYLLGASLFQALDAAAKEEGIGALASLVTALERSRDLGRGSVAVIRDARDTARAAERAASLEAASMVEGKLMLTLVLCYLPALMLLVVIPLFLTLLDGLFG